MSLDRPKRQILGHPAEQRTIGLGLLGLIGLFLPYAIILGSRAGLLETSGGLSALGTLGLLLLQAFASYIGNGINHNHCHRPTLATRRQNRVFNIFLSWVVGYPVSVLKIIHALNHHGQFATARDWSGTHHLPEQSFMGLIRYTLRAFRSMNQTDAKAHELSLRPALKSDVRRESRAVIVLVAMLLLISPLTFLSVTLPAWILSNFVAVMINALQHGGCDLKSPTHHSVNFTGRLYNYLLCNNGYHTWHHDHTDVHWSDLPARHRQDLDAILSADLNQPNFLVYVWKAYGPMSRRFGDENPRNWISLRGRSTSLRREVWRAPKESAPIHRGESVPDEMNPLSPATKRPLELELEP